MVVFLIYIALCVVAGVIGGDKKIGGAGAFFLSLFLSPLIGIIVAIVSDESDAKKLRDMKKQEELKRKFRLENGHGLD